MLKRKIVSSKPRAKRVVANSISGRQKPASGLSNSGTIPMSSAGWRKFSKLLAEKPGPNRALQEAARLLDERLG
jgi:hypothetical protein